MKKSPDACVEIESFISGTVNDNSDDSSPKNNWKDATKTKLHRMWIRVAGCVTAPSEHFLAGIAIQWNGIKHNFRRIASLVSMLLCFAVLLVTPIVAEYAEFGLLVKFSENREYLRIYVNKCGFTKILTPSHFAFIVLLFGSLIYGLMMMVYYIVLSWFKDDCFKGPWKSRGENFLKGNFLNGNNWYRRELISMLIAINIGFVEMHLRRNENQWNVSWLLTRKHGFTNFTN
ncbi:hypothetical protein DdX_13000 [Ditylenchus destructor]|uniref:Uncharacterized protein n=1 Tax=Ditylenchus destructor TaxID=166010 RepID=A0AAD4QZY7_9BILA|nr:hypothetical protein DdX_13000 [Ditylenchus destructor]